MVITVYYIENTISRFKASLQNQSGHFDTKVKQINSQSDLISMSSFTGPSYLTIKSSVCIIFNLRFCIFNLYNLCQIGSNYICRKPQLALHFNEQMTRTRNFLLLQPSIRPVPAQSNFSVERAAKTLHRMSHWAVQKLTMQEDECKILIV